MKNEWIYDFYKENPDFREYVDKFCKARGLGIFEAFEMEAIKNVALYYREKLKEKTE
ncbi:MAG: hypothetical protein IJV87_07470 [Clostridia bacterium]|nr:hypothetical protein [Clostridia bacterium]